MAIRTRLALGLLAMSVSVVAFGQQPGGGPPGGGGRGGFGGSRGMSFDPGQLFDRFANGKNVIVRSELDPTQRMGFDFMTQRWGFTGEQMTREQFTELFQKAMEQRRAGGGGGMGGFSRGDSAGAGPGASGSARDSNRGEGSRGEFSRGEFNRGDRGNWGGGGGFNPDAFAEARFRSLDKDGDGLLKIDEMDEVLATEREKWDTNNDGFIELSEYKAFFNARMQQRMNERAAAVDGAANDHSQNDEPDRRPIIYRSGKLPKDIPAWFSQLDLNQDGQISLAEWRASNRPIDEFKAMDRSGDNLLTIEETLLYVRLHKPSGESTAVASASGGSRDNGFTGLGGPGRGGFGGAGFNPGAFNPGAFGPGGMSGRFGSGSVPTGIGGGMGSFRGMNGSRDGGGDRGERGDRGPGGNRIGRGSRGPGGFGGIPGSRGTGGGERNAGSGDSSGSDQPRGRGGYQRRD